MAQAPDDEGRVQIQNQINQVIMQQYALINTYSQSVPMALAGRDKDLKQPEIKKEQEDGEKVE